MSAKEKRGDKGRGGKTAKSGGARRARRIVRIAVVSAAVAFCAMCGAGNWFVHHPPEWMYAAESKLPSFVTRPLEWFGYRTGDVTDALGWTGLDVVFDVEESTDPDPERPMFFAGAGAPQRVSAPAPKDIEIIYRDHFAVGWSPSLRRPVWVAYHVKPEVPYPELTSKEKRMGFRQDRNAPRSPVAKDYTNSNYDRGHMAPNRAIASRYGRDEQEKTFLMSNIAPQRSNLNQGPWANLEMRIADLWTERYGEIWVIVGAVPGGRRGKIGVNSDIDVPDAFFQIVIARNQTENEAEQTVKSEVRVLAVLMPQSIPCNAFYTRNIVRVKDIESLTGLRFFPELEKSFEERLVTDRGTRLWPSGLRGVFKLIAARFRRY